MARHIVRNLVRSPSIHTRSARIALLVWRIVRDLRLIEIRPSPNSIPKHLKLLEILHEQTIDGELTILDIKGNPFASGSTPATGTYPIQIKQGTLSSPNYAFTFVNGTLTVISPRKDRLLLHWEMFRSRCIEGEVCRQGAWVFSR
jgi:MBG domain (YGX type)